ncbi:glycoside hydrolase family 2 TIM barrel-domain containing protein [Flavicella sp.]|uniref:glycoside hydrolase family 2 TIM barrel-domain containing protein n=1 Tax=Flavicella sp. TaxID=2957742 RepID=UPI002638B786|nr:glycoside hydrolase family 2 TIM barrel-domain containing protein [Flavicella sp.]MDG1803563.1 glycoside hydrolase family 2 TIM barrel-domain containing protein [Flavicella sp.]
MKRFATLFLSLVLISLLNISCEKSEINKIKINSNWKFKLLEESEVADEEFSKRDFNDSDWELISLPHTAHIEPLVVNDQWQGICWYRKEFKPSKSTSDKKIFLELEAAMNHSQIWVNGEQVAMHQGGYLPVVIDVSKYIIENQKNVVAIRLNNRDNAITGPKPLNKLDFNMYGGLYRKAFLSMKEKVYISHPVLANKVAGGGVFIQFPVVSKKESTVSIKTHIINEEKEERTIQVVQSVYFKEQLVLESNSKEKTLESNSDFEFKDELKISNANLWSPKNPNLYHLKTEVLSNGVIVDSKTTRFGIREFTFDKENKLYINGERTFLRGVNRHQEYPFVGYALSDNAQFRDAKKIKEGGFNYIRLSHYPQSPAFMDACDELGIVVIDAILGWQYYLDNDLFREYCYNSARDLIRRDRNRPSVLAWEVSLNETKMPIFFMEKLDEIVHAEYPGENVYSCGWMNDVYDIFLQARQHRLLHHYDEVQPKPYSVSEYGDWEYYSSNAGLNQDKLSKTKRLEMSSRQVLSSGEKNLLQQAHNLQESHNDNMDTAAYSDSYWVMYDYNRGYHDEIEYSGIMDIFRLPKFGYYFYQSQRNLDDGAVLKIASYWNKKSNTDVKVFSNCDEVSLYLNTKLIATQVPDTNKNTTNLTHPPFTFQVDKFEAGELKAIGLVSGKEIITTVVKTPKKPSALRFRLDESGKVPQAGVNDVLFLYVDVVDENQTIVQDYFSDLKIDLKGSAEILNVGEIEIKGGRASILLRVGDKSGQIKIDAEVNKLKATFDFKSFKNN